MAGGVDPDWWKSDTPLEETIAASLQLHPHRERWKYTRVDKVLELVPACADNDPAVSTPVDIQAQLQTAPEALLPFARGHGLECITLADSDSLSLQDIDRPLHVKVAPNAQVTMVRGAVTHASTFLWLELAQGSRVHLALNALDGASHWDCLNVSVGRDASLHLDLHNQGALLARQDVQIQCREPGGEVAINSASCVSANRHLDQQITVQHMAPNTTSQQRFHSAAAEKSRVTFNGRIHIHEQCPGVAAHLSNRNLALSDSATINTKPELEIYTDDVSCSHGATVGALDDAELFYCLSRGVEPSEARRLLSMAFLAAASHGPHRDEAQQAFRAVLA